MHDAPRTPGQNHDCIYFGSWRICFQHLSHAQMKAGNQSGCLCSKLGAHQAILAHGCSNLFNTFFYIKVVLSVPSSPCNFTLSGRGFSMFARSKLKGPRSPWAPWARAQESSGNVRRENQQHNTPTSTAWVTVMTIIICCFQLYLLEWDIALDTALYIYSDLQDTDCFQVIFFWMF